MIAGIDLSTFAVDVVLLDEDSDAATWHRFELEGADAFDRARDVRRSFKPSSGVLFEDCLAIGIEDPRGYGAGSLYRVQGAILTCLPPRTLVHPLIPSSWRKTVGLPGNCPKSHVEAFTTIRRGVEPFSDHEFWPQDACDAYCIALATRTLLQRDEAA